METLPRLQTQNQFLPLAVAAHKVSQARFHHAPDADQSLLHPVATSPLASDEFLAFGTAMQIKQRPVRLLRQLMSRRAHPLGPASSKSSEVLEQNPHATQVAHHKARLIKRTQAGHEP